MKRTKENCFLIGSSQPLLMVPCNRKMVILIDCCISLTIHKCLGCPRHSLTDPIFNTSIFYNICKTFIMNIFTGELNCLMQSLPNVCTKWTIENDFLTKCGWFSANEAFLPVTHYLIAFQSRFLAFKWSFQIPWHKFARWLTTVHNNQNLHDDCNLEITNILAMTCALIFNSMLFQKQICVDCCGTVI